MFVVASLIGCGQSPATVEIEGNQRVMVHTLDAVAPNVATVLDSTGTALATQPELHWTVSPDTVAKLDGGKVLPVASGEAIVKACVSDAMCSEYTFVVAMPDAVVVNAPEGASWAVGTTVPLAAKVMAGEIEVAGQTVAYATDNAAVATVDPGGVVSAVTAGTANITATAGALTATFAVTVAEAAPEAPATH